VSWADLVVAHLDVESLPPATGLLAEVETLSGSRIQATRLTGDAKTLRITSRAGVEMEAPLVGVRVVRWKGGRFVYASDLPYRSKLEVYYGDGAVPSEHYEPWYGARTDRTAERCPLRVGGVTYRHGIAVHAKSTVTVPLERAFATFETGFGIDDETLEAAEGPRGDVTARVLVDGKEVWSSGGSVKGGEEARKIGPLDVRGAQSLVLEVDFGAGQHENDRADWVDPILVKAAP
jgi:hypothetical protein